jgi:membrane-bound lytic murein transglycosylase MltF
MTTRHAAAKYLAYLRDQYFSSDDIDPQARMACVWAAYNAGPAKARQMRDLADIRKWVIAYRLVRAHEQARPALP